MGKIHVIDRDGDADILTAGYDVLPSLVDLQAGTCGEWSRTEGQRKILK